MRSVPYYIKLAIVIAGCIGILFVVLNVFGVSIPGWIITLCWIVAAVFLGCLAVNLISTMLGGPKNG